MNERSKPVVLVPACNRQLGHHPFHIVGRKYVDYVRLAGALPLVVPNADDAEAQALLDLADGVLLTGSPSNVHPRHYDEGVHDPRLPNDRRNVTRDEWVLNIDVAPTLLAAAGVRVPDRMQGEDVAPFYLAAKPPAGRPRTISPTPTPVPTVT